MSATELIAKEQYLRYRALADEKKKKEIFLHISEKEADTLAFFVMENGGRS